MVAAMTRRLLVTVAVALAASVWLVAGLGACRPAATRSSGATAQSSAPSGAAPAGTRARPSARKKPIPFGDMTLPTLDRMPVAKGHAYKYKQMAWAAVIVLLMAALTYWVTKRYPSRRE